jgi:thiol-disulfide isomerase/thioredoxin
MKKIFGVFLLLSILANASAQTVDTVPPYKKDPHLPPFQIQLTDSTWFGKEQLPKYDYTAIIYFSPSCGHCQITAKDIAQHMDSLKNVFFVFVAYTSLPEIKEFYNYYGLNVFPNVRMGRDPKYYIPSFYRVEYTPFVGVYDRNSMLIQVFDPPHKPAMEAADLISLVNKK